MCVVMLVVMEGVHGGNVVSTVMMEGCGGRCDGRRDGNVVVMVW